MEQLPPPSLGDKLTMIEIMAYEWCKSQRQYPLPDSWSQFGPIAPDGFLGSVLVRAATDPRISQHGLTMINSYDWLEVEKWRGIRRLVWNRYRARIYEDCDDGLKCLSHWRAQQTGTNHKLLVTSPYMPNERWPTFVETWNRPPQKGKFIPYK